MGYDGPGLDIVRRSNPDATLTYGGPKSDLHLGAVRLVASWFVCPLKS